MHDEQMRTTIEIADDKLRMLRELAAARGQKGYSTIINEALEAYLQCPPEDLSTAKRKRQAAAILAAAGTINEAEAEAMRRTVRELRQNWQESSSTLTS